MIHALRRGARRAMLAASVSVLAITIAAPAYASGSSMPWEAPLQSILESIQGPVAKIVAVIIIIVTGLTLAFGDAVAIAIADAQAVLRGDVALAGSSQVPPRGFLHVLTHADSGEIAVRQLALRLGVAAFRSFEQ